MRSMPAMLRPLSLHPSKETTTRWMPLTLPPWTPISGKLKPWVSAFPSLAHLQAFLIFQSVELELDTASFSEDVRSAQIQARAWKLLPCIDGLN
mmetsp:Transcript_50816/g.105802  ORF Transcript_50816/g.105802 Transcript_50816/m.105802 type:complete len:94 (-) Transcript_50816:212-493(-)